MSHVGGSLRPRHRNSLGLPSARDFVRYPASWYLLCSAGELKKQPIKKQLFGRDLVIFRGADGRVVALDNRCAHLGADLSHGRIIDNTISCPFHGWRYDGSGRCVHIPNSRSIPSFARQIAFPIQERHGLIFIFNGVEVLFPLPFFADVVPAEYIAAPAAQFSAETSWYMVAAHGYDAQHFSIVHGRRLLTPLEVDNPAPFARRSRYHAAIAGATVYDQLLRLLLGRQVSISITTWGGTLVLITGDFGRLRSQFLISLLPTAENQTNCTVVVFARRNHGLANWMIHAVNLALRKMFTRAYLADEAAKLGRPRYMAQHLIEADRELNEYFRWAAALPEGQPPFRAFANS